ncbi:MAG: outer membrane protein assembly factor BamC [Betaproteobacteria bacterium]|nr:outer membrane protein assembly factor BamC [Betaproteobacteria bacterium]
MTRYSMRAVACLVVCFALAACGGNIQLPSKKVDYKSAGKLPSLEVPPDLTRPAGDDRFVVPDTSRGAATYSAYQRERDGRSEGISSTTVLPPQEGIRVERAGTQRWLIVKGEPEQLWPVVKDFWQETGFLVNIDMPEAGVMETDWAENRSRVPDGFIRNTLGKLLDSVYSTSERDKFRTRLERGSQSGTTEIYISHRGMEEVYTSVQKDDTKWQPRPPNPELEAEMLRRLMVRLGVQEARAKTDIASAASAPQRAVLQKGQDGSALALNEQFDRAWRRVGLALDRVGFTVEDRDRSKGLYYVRYIDPEVDNKSAEKKGWLSKFKFWGSSPEKQKKEQYRVLVRDEGERAEVNVLNKEGGKEQSSTANRILTLLYDQLK